MFLNTLLSRNAGEEGARRREVFQNIIYFNNPINKESDKGRHITADKEPGENTGLINRERNQEKQKQVE